MKKLLMGGVAAAAMGGLAVVPSGPANANLCNNTLTATGFPTNASACNEIITITNTGVATSIPTGATTNYDGVEDHVLGVINNSSSAVTSLHLVGGAGSNIFGFDGDGIQSFLGLAANSKDKSGSGYGGPLGFYSNLVGTSTGNVNFIGGLQPGATTYFSLEEGATLNTSITLAPEPATAAVLGAGLVGFGLLRRRRRR
jgi:hypothetical protein